MDIYKKVLITLDFAGTSKAKQNKYTRLMHESKDRDLSMLLSACAHVESMYIKPRLHKTVKEGMNVPRNHSEWLEMNNVARWNLRKYVEEVIQSQKPDWQVEAERNGWIPPSSAVN